MTHLPVYASTESEDEETASTAAALPAAVPCQLCEGPLATLPHCNCANLDCARLFVACDTCKVRGTSHRGSSPHKAICIFHLVEIFHT